MSVIHSTATELLQQLQTGDVSSVEITQAYLDRIHREDGKVNAFLRTLSESALAQAADVDQRRKAGETVGQLGGLPVAVKDVLCLQGQPTTCGSHRKAIRAKIRFVIQSP